MEFSGLSVFKSRYAEADGFYVLLRPSLANVGINKEPGSLAWIPMSPLTL